MFGALTTKPVVVQAANENRMMVSTVLTASSGQGRRRTPERHQRRVGRERVPNRTTCSFSQVVAVQVELGHFALWVAQGESKLLYTLDGISTIGDVARSQVE